MNKQLDDMDNIERTYKFLGTKDKYIVRLFHFIKDLNNFKDEIRSCEMDTELEEEIEKIICRLEYAMSERISKILP